MNIFSMLFKKYNEDMKWLNLKKPTENIAENDKVCKVNIKRLADNLNDLIDENEVVYNYLAQLIVNNNKEEKLLSKHFQNKEFIDCIIISSYYVKGFGAVARNYINDVDKRVEVLDGLAFLRDFVAYKTIKHYFTEESKEINWNKSQKILNTTVDLKSNLELDFANNYIKDMNLIIKSIDEGKGITLQNINIESVLLKTLKIFNEEYFN